MSAARFSFARVGWVAHNTILEAVRQRLFVLAVVLALFLVVGALFLREFNFGFSELKFLADFGFGALTLFGSVLAIVATAQLFFSEIENRTALTILAKPVFRAEFLLGKFLGVLAVLLVFTALITVALISVLAWREAALRDQYPDAFAGTQYVAYDGIVFFATLQWLKFGVIAAFTMLIASFAQTSLFSVITAFLILIICHLQHLAADAWTRVAHPVARLGAGALALLFPNFQLFNVGDRISTGESVSGGLAVTIAGYAMIYIVVLLGLASFSFRRREI